MLLVLVLQISCMNFFLRSLICDICRSYIKITLINMHFLIIKGDSIINVNYTFFDIIFIEEANLSFLFFLEQEIVD